MAQLLMGPEEALEIVESDEAADKRFNDASAGLAVQCEQMTTHGEVTRLETVSHCRETGNSEKVSATLEKLNKDNDKQK